MSFAYLSFGDGDGDGKGDVRAFANSRFLHKSSDISLPPLTRLLSLSLSLTPSLCVSYCLALSVCKCDGLVHAPETMCTRCFAYQKYKSLGVRPAHKAAPLRTPHPIPPPAWPLLSDLSLDGCPLLLQRFDLQSFFPLSTARSNWFETGSRHNHTHTHVCTMTYTHTHNHSRRRSRIHLFRSGSQLVRRPFESQNFFAIIFLLLLLPPFFSFLFFFLLAQPPSEGRRQAAFAEYSQSIRKVFAQQSVWILFCLKCFRFATRIPAQYSWVWKWHFCSIHTHTHTHTH